VPGLLVQLGMFGAAGVGFGLIAELRRGVVERMRVTPINRISLLLGRACRDMLVLVVQALLLILLSLPLGLDIHATGIAVMLALVALLGLMMASVSYAVALAPQRGQLCAAHLHGDAAAAPPVRRAAAAELRA
jgi:ABC-2 type transport system permease protein